MLSPESVIDKDDSVIPIHGDLDMHMHGGSVNGLICEACENGIIVRHVQSSRTILTLPAYEMIIDASNLKSNIHCRAAKSQVMIIPFGTISSNYFYFTLNTYAKCC